MSEAILENARKEIDQTFYLCTFSMKFAGISFTKPKDAYEYFKIKLVFAFSMFMLVYHVFGETTIVILSFINNEKIEEIVPLFHLCGYGTLSVAKGTVLWYKKDVFAKLIDELVTIWPVPPLDTEIQALKEKSLVALQLAHKWYFLINVVGVWFYDLTPIVLYFYRWMDGVEDLQMGYVWRFWYPFDKTTPFNHVMVYIFEVFSGQSCVWIMVSTDLLFSGLASHLCLLLRILQTRLLSLAATQKSNDEYYADIVENIKLHQRLIRYCGDIEEAFTFVNLVNYVLSSVTICCVVFVIMLLEPTMYICNKFFLVSVLFQIFVLCYYADDLIHVSKEVGDAAYNSGWYRTDPKCRRALIFLINRSQKPIAFTAMKFTNISLVTFTSILTRAYSYFALLYTMYSKR